MIIIADENITRVAHYFNPHGQLYTLPGREIDSSAIKNADVLLVRSVTKVDEQLLKNSNIKYVASATSGIDHIDIGYLKKRNIAFYDAAGCNANSVVEYVFASLALLAKKQKLNWHSAEFGIVGGGKIGGLLAKRLLSLKVKVAIYDPFLNDSNPHYSLLESFDEIIKKDIISIHTPLTQFGKYPTQSLFNQQVIERLKPEQVLINSARGGVIDNLALLERQRTNRKISLVLDAWENEPNINLELLKRVNIGTPHIAGYSIDGKLKGTELIYQGFCRYFGLAEIKQEPKHSIKKNFTFSKENNNLDNEILTAYPIEKDFQRMLKLLDSKQPGFDFDQLRKNYPKRYEFLTEH